MGYTTYKLEAAEFNHHQPREKNCWNSPLPFVVPLPYLGQTIKRQTMRGFRNDQSWKVVVMYLNNPKLWNTHLWLVYGVWYEYVWIYIYIHVYIHDIFIYV